MLGMQNSSSFFQGQPRFRNGFFGIYHSPFGVELKGRNLKKNNAKNYRYGYQGSEADDQVKGVGNIYSTYFRQLDPRLGRWLSIDPKATAWESPYVSMGNNPVVQNDPFGDTVKSASEDGAKAYEGYRKEINDRISQLRNDISKVTNQEDADKLNNSLQTYEGINKELDDLESSTEVYRIRLGREIVNDSGPGTLGSISANASSLEVDVNIKIHNNQTIMETLAHELKHANQFENFKLNFRGLGGGYTYDRTDEVEAYQRHSLFSSTTFDPLDMASAYNIPAVLTNVRQEDLIHQFENDKTTAELNYSRGVRARPISSEKNMGDMPAYRQGVIKLMSNLKINLILQALR
jgi:RHS repeat-associated protein